MHDLLHQALHVHVRGFAALGGHPRELQQVTDQPGHAIRAFHDELRVALRFRVADVQALEQQLRETGHGTQGFLKVMTGDVSELLQFVVAAFQFLGAVAQGHDAPRALQRQLQGVYHGFQHGPVSR